MKRNFGQWTVHTWGLEASDKSYDITRREIGDGTISKGYSWVDHMKQKSWINIMDFKNALNYFLTEVK